MRNPSRVLLGSLLGLLLLSAPPAAASGPPSDEPVGGKRLADVGVVVDQDAPDLPTGLTASSWLVADLDSGEVLAAKDAHGTFAPASTLKTLTAVALIPELDRNALVQAGYDDIAVEGSKVGLVERLDYPVHELFTALMTVSANDAANTLASAAGGQETTAKLMNATARELRALDTRAVNPHGLDAEGQVSSAYDLALIARAGMRDPQFAAYAATRRSSIAAPGGRRMEIATKNRLLKSYDGALGIKNGYTNAARASFIGAAERGGQRLIVTLMRAEPKVADEAALLLDWGFLAVTASAAPVGELVEPVEGVDVLGSTNQPGARPAPAAGSVDSGASGTTGGAPAATGPEVGTGAQVAAAERGPERLPAALAGFGLAAAAVLSVRHKPDPVRRSPAGSGGSHTPARPHHNPHGHRQPRPVPRTVAERVGPAAERPTRSGVA